MATTTATGYCMKCKPQREIKNAKQITIRMDARLSMRTCPVCSTKIFKIGARSKDSENGVDRYGRRGSV